MYMSRTNWETAGGSSGSRDDENDFRDIHALTPPSPPPLPPPPPPPISGRSWASSGSSENFSSMSREFNALVLAGSNIEQEPNAANLNLDRIGEDEEDNNPLAIVPDVNPVVAPPPATHDSRITTITTATDVTGDQGVHRAIKEEVDAKITAWQTAKIAKINNRYKRQDAIISGWEKEHVDKASTCMKIVQRKLEEKRAKALEKMENEIAKAHRKAEERRATEEGKRGRKVAKVLQVANLMRAVGRPPAKRSFF